MKFHAFHGVLPQERCVGNDFLVTIALTAPVEKAVMNDDIDATINYAAVYPLVKKEMDRPSRLLEHVAGRILFSLKEHFPHITKTEISLSKLNPPIVGEVHSASVVLTETYRAPRGD